MVDFQAKQSKKDKTWQQNMGMCVQWNQQPRHFFETTSKSLAKVCFAYFMQRLYHNNH